MEAKAAGGDVEAKEALGVTNGATNGNTTSGSKRKAGDGKSGTPTKKIKSDEEDDEDEDDDG